MSQGPEQHGMWLSILQWSLRQSDGTSSSSEKKPLSDEDKSFLMQAFSDMTKDEPKRLSEILKKCQELISSYHDNNLTTLTQDITDTLLNDLQEMRDIVEQIDMAHIMVKYGGVQVLLSIISCHIIPDDIKAVAIGTIGTVCQNHVQVQDMMYENGILDVLCMMISSSEIISSSSSEIMPTSSPTPSSSISYSENLIAKIIYAISCMIRGHHQSEDKFLSSYASSLVDHLMTSYHHHIIIMKRLLFLIYALITTHDHDDDTMIMMTKMMMRNDMYMFILSSDVDIRDIMMKIIYKLCIIKQHHIISSSSSSSPLLLLTSSDMISTPSSSLPSSSSSSYEELKNILQQRLSMMMPYDISSEQDDHEKEVVNSIIALL